MKEMKEQLTARDIQYIAEGCWRHNFNYKFHQVVKTPLTIAAITGIAGLATVIAEIADRSNDAVERIGPSVTSFVGISLVIVALGFFLWADWLSSRERERFIDYAVENWENGEKTIPTTEFLNEFLKLS